VTVEAVRSPAAKTEMEAAVLATLLKIRARDGYVTNADVRRAAAVLECTTRRIRRAIARGYVRQQRTRWNPDEDLTSRLIRGRGSVAGIHQELTDAGQAPQVSVRTMQRWFANHYDQRLLAGARGGEAAFRAVLPTFDRVALHRNDEWAIDHTLLPVWVVHEGNVIKPWMTTVLDAATRMVMAVTITPAVPTTEESVETIAVAAEGFRTEDGVRVGGRPLTLHSDRGGDLVTRALTLGLAGEGIQRSFTEAYTPQQNGKIERWHRTIKGRVRPLGLPAQRPSEGSVTRVLTERSPAPRGRAAQDARRRDGLQLRSSAQRAWFHTL
jgi:putative transposase